MSSCNFAVVIPAFNPGEIVSSVINAVKDFANTVILVDDGSNEENRRILNSLKSDNVTLITFDNNMGKGYALMSGLKEAISRSPDYIFTLDSDGQHAPEEIPKFTRFLSESRAPVDLLIGKRDRIDQMPLRSKVGNIFTSMLFSVMFGRKIVDTQSGFRVFSLDLAKELVENVEPGRYETEMKMLIHAVKSRRSVHELPIETIYLDNNSNSKFRPLQDSMRVLSVFSRYVMVAFGSFVLDYSIYLMLVYLLPVPYLSAHIVARVCSGTFNFFANRKIVFKSREQAAPEMMRYIATVIFSLSLSALLLFLIVDKAAVSKAIAKPSAEFVLFILNFLILNKFVFKKDKE